MLNEEKLTTATSLPIKTKFVNTEPRISNAVVSEVRYQYTVTDQNDFGDSFFDTREWTTRDQHIDVLILLQGYGQVVYNSAPALVFVHAVEQIEWLDKRPEFFMFAVELALRLELSNIANSLVQRGSKRYPENKDLQRAMRVLAPPTIIDRHRPAKKSLSESMKWLQENAHQYYGQWVAVLAGKLMGAAPSRAELVQKLADFYDEPEILITRIV